MSVAVTEEMLVAVVACIFITTAVSIGIFKLQTRRFVSGGHVVLIATTIIIAIIKIIVIIFVVVGIVDRFVDLVVRAEAPEFDSRLRRGDFSRSSQISDLKIGTAVAPLPGGLRYRVSARRQYTVTG